MNQLLVREQNQSDCINVNIVVLLQQASLNLQTSIPSEIPLYIFINGIKEQIFAQRMQTQYEEHLELQLDTGMFISQYENKTLQMLGFKNNCTLYIRLKLLGYQTKTKNNNRLYKVLVDLKNTNIQLFVEQLKTTPVSSVFHDILVELFQNYQIDPSLPFIFFINGAEVQPFDVRLIQDFQTKEGIIIQLMVPKIQPNQDSQEKSKFALIKSKQIKRFQRKIIMIEGIDKMQFFTYNDISLQEIFEKIKEDFQLQHSAQQYQINNEISYDLCNIYTINDFKFAIQQNVVTLIGEFYKKIKIKGFLDGNGFIIEETMPINTSMIEFLKDFKYKLFGPKQNNFNQEIIEQNNYQVVVHWSSIKK